MAEATNKETNGGIIRLLAFIGIISFLIFSLAKQANFGFIQGFFAMIFTAISGIFQLVLNALASLI
jgi:hypothetical protein